MKDWFKNYITAFSFHKKFTNNPAYRVVSEYRISTFFTDQGVVNRVFLVATANP